MGAPIGAWPFSPHPLLIGPYNPAYNHGWATEPPSPDGVGKMPTSSVCSHLVVIYYEVMTEHKLCFHYSNGGCRESTKNRRGSCGAGCPGRSRQNSFYLFFVFLPCVATGYVQTFSGCEKDYIDRALRS